MKNFFIKLRQSICIHDWMPAWNHGFTWKCWKCGKYGNEDDE